MITQLNQGPNTPLGYIALHQRPNGEWVPITSHIFDSPTAARLACTELNQQTLEMAADCVERAQANLHRLHDHPRSSDRVRLGERLCTPSDDGVLTMPDDFILEPPHPLPHFTIEDDTLYETLVRALELDDTITRPSATRLIVDALLNEPVDLLTAVDDLLPDMLPKVAALLVHVARLAEAAAGAD